MSDDRTTPLLDESLRPDGHQAIRLGAGFLSDKERQLQARLAELDGELAGLDEVPDNIHTLERRATDALQALMEVLNPQARATPVAVPPQPEPARVVDIYKPRRRLVAVGITMLALMALAGLVLAFMAYRLPMLTEVLHPPATTAVVAITRTPVPTLIPLFSPTALPITPTLTHPPVTPAPSIPQAPAPRSKRVEQAHTLEIVGAWGTPRLETSLTVMTETIEIVDGVPILKPVPPTNGAGLHRGSAPFGEAGTTIVAIQDGALLGDLQQIRPGGRMVGCNTDGDCHDYQVTTAATWDLGRLHQVLADWPPDLSLMVYLVTGEADAWVIQAQPRGEKTR